PGYGFLSWSGDLTGTNNPARLTMDRDKAVRGNFISLAAPALARAPVALTNFVGAGQLASTQNIQVWNSGGSILNYSITSSAPWLSLAPSNGTSIEETNTHTVAVVASNLAVGSYHASILVNPGSSLVQTVNLTLVVLPRSEEHTSELQ